jgi:hypothetical protein
MPGIGRFHLQAPRSATLTAPHRLQRPLTGAVAQRGRASDPLALARAAAEALS